jgi:aminopeptidase
MSYVPPQEILEKYAKLLIDCALGEGAGVQRGDVVYIVAEEDAKPLFIECAKAVWRSGGHVIPNFRPASDSEYSYERSFFEIASDEQLDFAPNIYFKGLVDQMDHLLFLYGERDLTALRDADPAKQMRNQASHQQMMEWRMEKENAGKLQWCIGQYGTEGAAAEAGLSIEQYWDQIIKACNLDDPDPIARWNELQDRIHTTRDWLNTLPIDTLHMVGEDCDITFKFGEKRRWVGGSGRNVPSFEIFTSPDWRGSNGWIRFSEPLYESGNLITNVRLEFKDGLVVSATADQNEKLLQEMIATENANRVGEFSLTDARISRIDKFMASTLYDENTGGPFGNTHVAVGLSLPDTYDGDPGSLSDEQWEQLGYNKSVVHTDIVSTADRTVTATMTDGSTRVIYKGGQFQNG